MPTKSRSSKSRSSGSSKMTTNHEEIRAWAEERDGQPACVKGTGGKRDTGLLRIDFPGRGDDTKLKSISWEEFFEKFDEQKLAMVYQDQTRGGEMSRFSKLVKRTGGASTRKSSSRTSKARANRAHPGSRTREGSSTKTRGSSRTGRQKSGKTRR